MEEGPMKIKYKGPTKVIWGPDLHPALCSQHQPPWLVATSCPCLRPMLVTTYMLGTLLLAPAGVQGVESQSRNQQLGELPSL